MNKKRKADEQFKQEVFDLVENEYTVIGTYIHSDEKIKMKHNVCNKEFEMKPGKFLSGQRCPYCAKHRKTTEDYKQEIFDLAGDEYTLIGEYVNAQTKVKLRHNCKDCGNYEYEVYPGNFRSGQRCPKCFKKVKKTDEQFKQEVSDLVGDEYTVLGTYEGIHKKILMRHNCEECNNHEYEVSPNAFLSGSRCPECARIAMTKRVPSSKKTLEEFKQEVFDLVGSEFTVLEEYKNSATKIRMRHNCEKCDNFEFDILPNNFLLGIRCAKCSGKKKRTTEEFKEEVHNLVGDEYTILGEYKNRKTKIKMRHNCKDCGNYEYEVQPSNFLNGNRCPQCARNRFKE